MNITPKEDRAVGVVPVFTRADGNVLYCIVRETDGHWGFPKGHTETGESDEQTARRELHEETGINEVEIDRERTFEEEYMFERDGTQYHKVVAYFLGRVRSMAGGTTQSFKSEIPEMRWVSYEEAEEILTYPEARRVLKKVWEFVNKRLE